MKSRKPQRLAGIAEVASVKSTSLLRERDGDDAPMDLKLRA